MKGFEERAAKAVKIYFFMIPQTVIESFLRDLGKIRRIHFKFPYRFRPHLHLYLHPVSRAKPRG